MMKKLQNILVTFSFMFVSLMPSAPLAAATAPYSFTEDSQLVINGIALTVKAGSTVESLTNDDTTFTVTVPENEVFEIRFPLPAGPFENDGFLPLCDVLNDLSNRLLIFGPKTVRVNPQAGPLCSTLTATTDNTSMLSMPNPVVDSVLNVDAPYLLFWTSLGLGVQGVTLRLSSDGGKTYPTTLADKILNTGYFEWTPDSALPIGNYRLRIDGWDAGRISAFAISPEFRVEGGPEPAPPVEVVPTPAPYDYEIAEELRIASTISVDKGLIAGSSVCHPNSRIKLIDLDTVYYCGIDGKRYVFPNKKTHDTWYNSFVGVIELDLETIQKIPLAGNVTYRPGARLVKVQSSPEVFAVTGNGMLRYVSEAAATRLYGENWNQHIDDIPDAFFTNYSIGTPILE